MISHGGDLNGGAEVVFRDMAVALRGSRPNIELIAVYPWAGQLAADITKLGVRDLYAPLPAWTRKRHWTYIGGLTRFVAGICYAIFIQLRLRPALVITNTMVIPSHAIAAKILRTKHYWMIHEFGRADHQFDFIFGYDRTIRWIGSLSKLVICNSQAVEQVLLSANPSMNSCVLYPMVSDAPAVPSERGDGEPLRAILVGRFAPSKGQHLAIQAIAAARRSGVDIRLTLVGSGESDQIRHLARQLDVEDLVDIHGWSADVRAYWAAAHVALMCSDAEAFGLVTVEAMRAGLPVCGTNSGGTPEIIRPGENGLLSPAGDADALAENLTSLESNEPFRRGLAVGAMQASLEFTREYYVENLLRIMDL